MKPLPLLCAIALIVEMQIGAASAESFRLVRRFGKAVKDRQEATKDRVLYASWIDSKTILFATDSRNISAIGLRDGKTKWTKKVGGNIRSWSVDLKTRRLAYCLDYGLFKGEGVCVLNGLTGKSLLEVTAAQLARALKVKEVTPACVALSPKDGSLVLCSYSGTFGRNGYVLSPSYHNCIGTFRCDAYPKRISVSANGSFVSTTGYKEVAAVRSIIHDCDVFLRGRRIITDKEAVGRLRKNGGSAREIELAIDRAFYSDIRYDGHRTVVVSTDLSEHEGGKVVVHDLSQNTKTTIKTRNHHIEMDVDFELKRIAITGTSRSLHLVGFDGKEIAKSEGVSFQRNLCIDVSPSRKHVLVGSWDNTIGVFEIVK